jgi:hypothetical protein
MSRGQFLWDSLDAADCGRRIEAWRRADGYTVRDSELSPVTEPATPYGPRAVAPLRNAG